MMTRGAWLGALALGLGGWLSGAGAQHAVWRPVSSPSRPVVTARAASPGLEVSAGRPVAASAGPVALSTPGQFPRAYRAGPDVSPLPRPLADEPAAMVFPPGTIIATSARPAQAAPRPAVRQAEASVDHWQGDLFATDRGGSPEGGIRRVGAFEPALPGDAPAGSNWQGSWPALPAQPALPAAPAADLPLFGTDLPPPRWYLVGEYLLWWTKADQAPPLATTGDPRLGVNSGFLGQPGTVVLNDGRLDPNPRHGGRFLAGLFLDDCGMKAVEVGGLFLGTSSSRFVADSAQYPVLVRPFFAANPNLQFESGQRVAFPGVSAGRLTIEAPSELWGLEANLNCKVCCACDYRINLLGGARFLRLRESLTITEDIQNTPGPDPFNGNRVIVQDRFGTKNDFYGGQVGAEARWQRGRVTVDGRAKLALGVTRQTVDISGSQAFPSGTAGVEDLPGGLLATNSNIGRYSRDRFSVVPEVGVNVGYFLTERLRASVGYNFLYWSNVARPGDQIDRNLDLLRIPNFARPPGTVPVVPARPAPLLNDTGFWAQGLTFGVEYRY